MAALRQAACLQIALAVAQRVGCQADCALTRVYRLLHNRRLEDRIVSREMIRTLARGASPLLVALDWTEWHPPLRMLLASVVVGTRAVPVSAAAVQIRVVGIWAKGHREPWWLATNRSDSLARLVAYYDRRMAIEEQIRDTKGARFGFALVWTQIKTPDALARFVLLIGLAVLLLTAVGHAIAANDASIRLPSKTKGPRLSLLSVGLLLWPLLESKLVITPRFLTDHPPPPSDPSPGLTDMEKENETVRRSGARA